MQVRRDGARCLLACRRARPFLAPISPRGTPPPVGLPGTRRVGTARIIVAADTSSERHPDGLFAPPGTRVPSAPQVRNMRYSALIEGFTSTTYAMVIVSDPAIQVRAEAPPPSRVEACHRRRPRPLVARSNRMRRTLSLAPAPSPWPLHPLPRPSTLSPRPSTLSPRPSTLSRTLSALAPALSCSLRAQPALASRAAPCVPPRSRRPRCSTSRRRGPILRRSSTT